MSPIILASIILTFFGGTWLRDGIDIWASNGDRLDGDVCVVMGVLFISVAAYLLIGQQPPTA